MTNIYENLTWLPQQPKQFAKMVSEISNLNDLIQLSKFALDENALRRLSKKFTVLRQEQDSPALTPLTLGVASNATTSLNSPPIIATALRYGVALNIVEAEFNQLAQEAFSSESSFTNHSLNALLVAIDYRGLPVAPCPGDIVLAKESVESCVSYLSSVVVALREKTGAHIILQNIALPPDEIAGSYEARLPGTLSWLIANINAQLDTLIGNEVCILDVAGLASKVGTEKWNDPKLWNIAKLSFSQIYVPIYAEYICRILGSMIGKSRRCLILDLDNTLWGGVIGDDGLDGILIGNGDPTGEAHLNLQKTVLELRSRGIVLAISSKNEDSIARQPFRKHPDMLIREEHIAVFQANWTDKASNIKAIAETLSLGLESIVFLDDNPAERMQVRFELPDVCVPELPADPALYARTLIAAGYFETCVFSDEDLQRASFYQENAARTQMLKKSSNMDAYLASLKMKISINKFDDNGRARIAQLITKSNQFNLTTRRYSESEIKEMEVDPSFFTRQIRLVDTLGDNGMISVVICKRHSDLWEIDTWLMSCRVLGRGVEVAVLQDIVTQAKEAGVGRLLGFYIPSNRNVIVKDHYLKLGFTKVAGVSSIETWELELANYEFREIPITFTLAKE